MQRVLLLMAALTTADLTVTDPPNTEVTCCFTPDKSTAIVQPTSVFRSVKATARPRKKPMRLGKADSPMLNYIFDSYATSNKHFHDTFKAPSFESSKGVDDTTLDADTGATVFFDCRVTALRDKMVSWLRVSENDNLELLTLDLDTHTADSRYRVDLAGDNWRLQLSDAKVNDSGVYCCHVSTHPPLLRRVKLAVYPPEMKMATEAFLETGETLSLKCSVLHLHAGANGPAIVWYRGNDTSPLDEVRGGVSIDTDQLAMTSQLQVASLKVDDAGNYTCALEAPIPMRSTARVHVLQGSSLGELQSGVHSSLASIWFLAFSVILTIHVIWKDPVR